MAISSAQKSDIISRYRQVITQIMANFTTVKGLGDQIVMLGLLDPEDASMLTPEDFIGENAVVDLERFAAAAAAMGALDAAFDAAIRRAFYGVMF